MMNREGLRRRCNSGMQYGGSPRRKVGFVTVYGHQALEAAYRNATFVCVMSLSSFGNDEKTQRTLSEDQLPRITG